MHSIPSPFSPTLRESWAEVMPPFFPTGRDFPSATTTTTTLVCFARLSITFKEQTRENCISSRNSSSCASSFFCSSSLIFSPINTEGLKIIRFTILNDRTRVRIRRWRNWWLVLRVDHERDESLARAAIDTETVQEYIRYDAPVGQLIPMINGASHWHATTQLLSRFTHDIDSFPSSVENNFKKFPSPVRETRIENVVMSRRRSSRRLKAGRGKQQDIFDNFS